ncbi:hypothetical protein GCM10010273_33120 [Streptomyces lavendulocolor]
MRMLAMDALQESSAQLRPVAGRLGAPLRGERVAHRFPCEPGRTAHFPRKRDDLAINVPDCPKALLTARSVGARPVERPDPRPGSRPFG